MLLGIISGASKELLRPNMQETMQIIAQGIQNQNMRVRYAALNALGMLATDLAPYLQKRYTHEILPVLITLMINE